MQQYAEVLEGRVCILLMSLSPGDREGPEDILNEGEGKKIGNKRNHFARGQLSEVSGVAASWKTWREPRISYMAYRR